MRPTKSTVVVRDGTNGVCNIANLRVMSRETDLDNDGLVPDGGPPGLFFTKGTFSEQLRMTDNAQIAFLAGGDPTQQPPVEPRRYRFGAVSGAEHQDTTGLHFENESASEEINLRLKEDDSKLRIVGHNDEIVVHESPDHPLVEFQTHEENVALKLR